MFDSRTEIHVLLVEDNPSDAAFVRESLGGAKAAHFTLEIVDRLSAALDRLKQAPVDVVLLDLGLPDSEGVETLRRLYESHGEDTAIIVLTGIDDDTLGPLVVQLGAQDYLNKNLVLHESALQLCVHFAHERKRRETIERQLDRQRQELHALQKEMAERQRAEEERRKLEVQLQQTQKLESLGVLAGGIAHDFNNLLMGILGHADLALLELPAGSSAWHLITEAINGARRAAELTKQMLAYSGKGRFVVEPLNLSNLTEDMTRLLQISISKKCLLNYTFTPDLPAVGADPAQMRQIIMNLIINASEAIGDRSGAIAVSTGVMPCDRAYLSETYLGVNLPEGQYVYLEVADTGCGMTPETQAKIFDPFFTTKFVGRGLGLSAVLGIVRGHQGALKVSSEPGKGTTFKVLFPATAQPAKADARPELGTKEWRGSGTVLIVDDEAVSRLVACRMMQTMGFTVLAAADGREGVEVFRRESARIRLVLLDLTMPHLDGDEAFREMKRIRDTVKAILTSGYNEQTATSQLEGKGLAAFIQKPYHFEELRSVVRRVLENERDGNVRAEDSPNQEKI